MYELFDYKAPDTLEEAMSLMQSADGNYTLYAGGTDVLIHLRAQKLTTNLVIDVKKIPQLQGIQETDAEIRIGAAVTHSEVEGSPCVSAWYPALCHAVSEVGSVPIRNKATLVGNIQNASPAGDGSVAAFALDAVLEVASNDGIRRLPLTSFYLAPGKTLLEKGEIITAVILPKRKWTDQRFFKIGKRNALAISVVNGVVALECDVNGIIRDCRIALGAVAPKPIRILQAEQLLIGNQLTEELAEAVSSCVKSAISPISDIRASKEYRQYIAGVQVKRQLLAAMR